MKIIVASNNEGKIKEIKKLLPNYEVLSLVDIGYKKDIDEYGKTFHINALIKAQEIAKEYPKDIIISDDSGLCVNALNNQPGVLSARYAKGLKGYIENKDKTNNEQLLKNMEDHTNRTAFFITVMCIIKPGEEPIFASGKLEGTIAKQISEGNGFGYDPIFKYQGEYLSQKTIEEKNQISHRSKALAAVKEKLNKV